MFKVHTWLRCITLERSRMGTRAFRSLVWRGVMVDIGGQGTPRFHGAWGYGKQVRRKRAVWRMARRWCMSRVRIGEMKIILNLVSTLSMNGKTGVILINRYDSCSTTWEVFVICMSSSGPDREGVRGVPPPPSFSGEALSFCQSERRLN